MKPVRLHHPGEPIAAEPPQQLLALADSVRDPLVVQCGITTTADGQWALYVTVPAEADVPIPSVEIEARGYPVVYEAELKTPVRAGPAYPGRRR